MEGMLVWLAAFCSDIKPCNNLHIILKSRLLAHVNRFEIQPIVIADLESEIDFARMRQMTYIYIFEGSRLALTPIFQRIMLRRVTSAAQQSLRSGFTRQKSRETTAHFSTLFGPRYFSLSEALRVSYHVHLESA
jgi:hypothetical protein